MQTEGKWQLGEDTPLGGTSLMVKVLDVMLLSLNYCLVSVRKVVNH